MIDFNVGGILNLMMRTLPFLAFRFVVYIGITLAYVVGIAVGAGTGYVVDRIAGGEGGFIFFGGLFGFGAVAVVAYMLREYLLYLVKAGHIAVLVELMEGKELPGGRSQIDHAQAVVRERFAESSVLFAVDQLIKGILRAFNRVFFTITAFIPIPGLQGIVKFVNTVVNLSLSFLDEVILAYNIRTRTTNPWDSSRTALVLYAQNYKAFLKNAFFLALIIWVLTFFVFILALAPAAAVVSLMPGAAGPFMVVVALIFAWGVKQAVIEPFGMIALMQVFFKVTEGQAPNAEWEARLDSVSNKFGELKQKASDWTRAGSAPGTAPVVPQAPPAPQAPPSA
jgi:hypothetical protein